VKKWLPLPPRAERSASKVEAGTGGVVALIKPQFEAGKKDVARGDGVIRDPEIHKKVLLDVLTFAQSEGFQIHGLIKSPLLGPKGNAEFLVWLDNKAETEGDVNEIVNKALD
jgi:23S rRNA (cytidine1920-2'-O)/16S rRNA (cytidine1409-2'-O)-methyltransferase